MINLIDLRNFTETEHREIIKSLSRGMREGVDLAVIGNFASDQLKDVAYDLREVNVLWKSKQLDEDLWKVNLHKSRAEELQGGCCGMCGGGKK